MADTLTLAAHSDAPFYDFESELEGNSYTFEFRWNARAAAWFFTLYDAAGSVIVAGRKVVIGVPLFGRSVDERHPPGFLAAIDTSDADADPGRSDLGSRVLIVYTLAGA